MAAIVLSFLFTYFRFALNPYYGLATPAMLVQGTAFVPFQYRVLIPILVRGLTGIFPSLPILNAYQLVELAASIGLSFALRHFISYFVPNRLWAALAALGVFYCLSFNFMYVAWYPWDIPSVLFITLGLVFLYRRNWPWYYLIFVLATLNRETSILLTLSMVVVSLGSSNKRQIAKHAAAQIGLWAVIKLALYFLYVNNPRLGYGVFEPQIVQNLGRLVQLDKLLRFLANWGLIWLPVVVGIALIKDRFISRLLIVPLVHIGILLFVGVFDEMRIYGESLPIILTAFAIIVYHLWRNLTANQNQAGLRTGPPKDFESGTDHSKYCVSADLAWQ